MLQTATRPPLAAPATSTASRLLMLAYGGLIYLFFLATFLYAVGFVSGVGVPKTIDSGPAGPIGEALLVNGLILGLFAVQHMIMARQWFKRRWTRIIPAAAERSTFVLFTCLILCLMYWQWRPIPGTVWQVTDPVTAGVLTGLGFLGWGIVLVATFLIDHFDLFGLKQVVRYFRGSTHKDPAFKVVAFYKYIRHPLYLGFLMAFWCTPHMTWGHLFFAVMTAGFMLVAVRFEESDLIKIHGDDYRDYRSQVPMIFPRPGHKYS